MENSKNKKAYVFLGLSLGIVALSGLGVWYFKKKKQTEALPLPEPEPNIKPTVVPVIASSTYPLHSGSRGDLVKQLQTALIEKFGANIKADGVFGEKTFQALQKNGLPVNISAVDFAKILLGQKTGETPKEVKPVVVQPEALTTKQAVEAATRLSKIIQGGNVHAIVAEIRRLKNTSNYMTVNEVFKNYRTNGVRQTIVNAALNSVLDAGMKQFIKDAFLEIGLKYNDASKQWSLSGIGKWLKTKCNCTVKNKAGIKKRIPKNTFIGREVATLKGLTAFQGYDNQIMFVPSSQIAYE